MLVETYLSDGWEFCQTAWDSPDHKIGFSKTEWLPANVPGHVHLDLMAAGIIPDPFERMNEMGVQWVDQEDWAYCCKFHWTPSEGYPKRVLHFEGLDTIAKIYLNGTLIGEHENMFIPKEIDVTSALIDGENELKVVFASAVKVGEKLRAEYLAKEGMADNTSRIDERAFVRKIQCMYGWDWGPRLVSCGLWKPVKLVEYTSRILDIQTYQTWLPDGSVKLKVDVSVEGNAKVAVALLSDDEPVLEGNSVEFHVASPDLWWPVGTSATPGATTTLSVSLHEDDATVDYQELEIGFCEIKLLREKDDIGESFEFSVNGMKLFVRGANWIPDHSFPSIIDRSQLEERIGQAVDLGCNMLRVWGGGAYESRDFYELCTREGVMVWQDFLFACSYYPDDEIHQQIIKEEAEVNVLRLRNYPCLALWCGNNENLQMWQQKWGGADISPKRYYGENLYNKTLPEVVGRLDAGRSYIASSPIGDSEPDCNGGKFGDSHYWDVWHGRGDWRYYADSEARFSSEYGFAGSCTLALWEETLSDEDWDPRSPAVRWHNKTGKPQDVYEGFVKLHYPHSETLEDWVYYSQLNQRDAFRFGVEHFRRSSFCRGSIIWQLNDCWPVQSWAVIDSSGRYRAAAYELRRLHSNIMYSLQRKNDKVFVHAVNDEPEVDSLPLSAMVEAIDLKTGEVLKTWAFGESVAFNQRTILGEVDLNGLSVPDTILSCSGTYGGRTWHLLGEPKEMRFAEPLRIVASNRSTLDAEGTQYLDLKIEAPVVDLMLSVDGDTSIFDENFLTFCEPGVYSIKMNSPVESFEARSLSGYHPTFVSRSPLVTRL